MIYNQVLPDVDAGVTILSGVQDAIMLLIKEMLHNGDMNDRYLFIVGIEPKAFRAYYQQVEKRCYEINRLFEDEDVPDEETLPTFPKGMFLFTDMESCLNFKMGFDKSCDAEEEELYELSFASNANTILNITMYQELGSIDEYE